MTLREALRTSIFWALSVAFAASAFASVTVTVHMIPFLAQHGYAATYAAAAVGWIGAMQIPGRLVFVPISAWVGRRAVTGSVFLVQAAGMALLPFVGRLPTLIPAILLLGAGNGMATLARPAAVADVFGRRYYASVNGAIGTGSNGARALAPVGAALLGALAGKLRHAVLDRRDGPRARRGHRTGRGAARPPAGTARVLTGRRRSAHGAVIPRAGGRRGTPGSPG